MELETQLLLAHDLQFMKIPPELSLQMTEASRVLQGLISSLQRQ